MSRGPLTLRIATRNSPLALEQVKIFESRLEQQTGHQGIFQRIAIKSLGDHLTDHPLKTWGGKGLFIHALEHALLAHRADIAIHSAKDLPTRLAQGLSLVYLLPREDPRDALVTPHPVKSIMDLPPQAVIGTTSPRRQAQILMQRPDLIVRLLRGNIETRLRKLDENQYDAIILAAVGLHRLGLKHRIACYLDINTFLPCAGQAIIAVECRCDDVDIHASLASLSDHASTCCLYAERAVNQVLGAGCSTPIGVYAELNSNDQLHVRAMLFSPDGRAVLQAEAQGEHLEYEALGQKVAQQLLDQGGKQFL